MTDRPNLNAIPRSAANHVPLTPLSFLSRTVDVHPDHTAVIYGEWRYSYREMQARCLRLASALSGRGIGVGDCVAVMAPNVPALLECHFGVPHIGAVLNAINTRLDPGTVEYILTHSGARVLFIDRELAQPLKEVLSRLSDRLDVFEIDDPATKEVPPLGVPTYESLLTEGSEAPMPVAVEDEWQSIALNYTSGTTGRPKGVLYHHRGAYLNALGNQHTWSMGRHPVYLWTLPMFHCNGWCFPWTITANAGTHVCLRRVEAGAIFDAINGCGVTHFCGAPVVLNMLANAPEDVRRPLTQKVQAFTAGAAPAPSVIGNVEKLGVEIMHVYGLTEVYGPCVVCEAQPDWPGLGADELAGRKARQGVRYATQEDMDVVDPDSGAPVPADGETMGEIVLRGNAVMKGYLEDESATATAFKGGWFSTGDLAVRHADGYVQISDRLKDIIISGGENVSTIEVEGVLYQHDGVLDAAVVAEPSEQWGESVCAFVEVKPGRTPSEEELIAFCRDRLAGYKRPRRVVFGELPKTSTGKIQKFLLRQKAKELASQPG